MTVPLEKAPANFVPAAAVIRRVQALFGIIGRKGCVDGMLSQLLNSLGLTGESAVETGMLEGGREKWNSRSSGKMRRSREEHRWRRQLLGPFLTLRHESVGSKQD